MQTNSAVTYLALSKPAKRDERPTVTTYSMNNALQSSSLLVNACKALHVAPSLSKCGTCSVSKSWMSNSSGRSAKDPADDLQFAAAVKAFPDGLTPR